jgi:hypothetical protein
LIGRCMTHEPLIIAAVMNLKCHGFRHGFMATPARNIQHLLQLFCRLAVNSVFGKSFLGIS